MELRKLSYYLSGFLGKKLKKSSILTRYSWDKQYIIISTRNKIVHKHILNAIEQLIEVIPTSRRSPLEGILPGNRYECLISVKDAERLMTILIIGGYYIG